MSNDSRKQISRRTLVKAGIGALAAPAVLRVLPNIVVLCPADQAEVHGALRELKSEGLREAAGG